MTAAINDNNNNGVNGVVFFYDIFTDWRQYFYGKFFFFFFGPTTIYITGEISFWCTSLFGKNFLLQLLL